MTSTYTQKSDAIQRMASHNAASIMDSSAQGVSLQRKANIANKGCMCSVFQCVKEQFFPSSDAQPHFHKHKNGVTFKGLKGRHKDVSDNQGIRVNAINEVRALINQYYDNSEINVGTRDYLLRILDDVLQGRLE